MNSLSFRMSEKVFSLYIWNILLLDFNSRWADVFPFIMLRMLHHCFLACVILWPRIDCICIFVPLHPFPLAACEILLFLTGCERFDLHQVLWHAFFPSFGARGSMILNLWVYSIYHIKNNFSHYFLKYFPMSFSSPWESLITCLLSWLKVPHGSLSLYLYILSLFVSFPGVSTAALSSAPFFSSAMFSLLLSPLSTSFISGTVVVISWSLI